ncbi:helicase-like protein [Pochonia chlamydosporia 170]|uniref:Helicase-like protein n=1 Tax=Pochonia chlamydosporia 170 TaxID=1380566 RepID=A0A179FSA2_METCM|nr:helicase-like protein [Pochonia chlamydosporia 170]OAQ68492.1 helicase-like protein [Pochonia chlamydosporia 170]
MSTTLSEEDIEKLFSGAPQFFARNESHFYGAPHPSIAFLFDEELEIRDLTDHVQIEDKAWGGMTAWPHLTRDTEHDAAAKRQMREKSKAHFHVKCRERPNMMSMQGLEKGTMGYQAALELPAGDSLEEEQFGFESLGTKAKVIVEARAHMLSHTGMLRRIPEPELLDRLKRNSEIYRHNDLKSRTSVETYKDLFHNFMRPTSTVTDQVDHYGLNNQIRALLKCLGVANVWIDFSRVEWRIRLGQVLWGENDGDELDDDTAIHDTDDAKERAEEKYWLLMQILLATELLIRLDAVTEGIEYGVTGIRPIDVVHFERAASQTVKWSLLLARSWLDNIDIVKEDDPLLQRPPAPRRGSSWLGALASKVTNRYHKKSPTLPYHYTIKGRNGERQVEGLTHFAKNLMWPGIDRYETKISENAQNAVEETPGRRISSLSIISRNSSNFGAWDITCNHGKHKGRAQAQRRRLAAALHESGWLTKSYVFGLIIPGDSLCHYLMATLLENDTEAMAKLGPFANLSGGFVYSGKSFWSTGCIVGRVLAAGKGAAECMGWVSTDVLPEGVEDGWLTIEVDDVAEDVSQLGKKARLWGKKKVERESSILGDGKENFVQASDFIIPHENKYPVPPPPVYVELLSLDLTSSPEPVPATPLSEMVPTPTVEHCTKCPELISYPAGLKFFVSIGGAKGEEYQYPLTYDVNFVTAHPCAPSQRVRVVKSPVSSPTASQIDGFGNGFGNNPRASFRTGHPLHKFYEFTVIHISELIKKPRTTLSEFLLDSTFGKVGSNRVLVIDCITGFAEQPQSPAFEQIMTPSSSPILDRKGSFSAAARMHLESQKRQFGSDMEMMVRAICSQRGWNAIISRRKRSCLACAIREAGALAWKVIIRVP